MVAECTFEGKVKLFRVFNVSGYKLSTLGHPLSFCAPSLFFAHAAKSCKKAQVGGEFYFVIFNFCDSVLVDAGAILRFGRNVNGWVV